VIENQKKIKILYMNIHPKDGLGMEFTDD